LNRKWLILKLMNRKTKRPFTIRLRLADGWSQPVENRHGERCDLDGAKLWIGPGGQVYCDLVHGNTELKPRIRSGEPNDRLNFHGSAIDQDLVGMEDDHR